MTKRPEDKQFADQAKAIFDDSVESLDAATLSRLNRGRQTALAEVERARPMRHWLRWAPAAGVAAAAVLAVIMLQNPSVDVSLDIPATVTDFEILMDENSIEMFEELEFYALMEELEAGGNVS